ncbi:MAG: HAMP domain-containing histidine kinase [Leptospirales bacterium]|nr:HAMP domain-containing histidine kinase [Leptospirales bacterium]
MKLKFRRVPFAVRLGVAIAVPMVSVTALTSGLVYNSIADEISHGMRTHTRSLAHTGSYLFTAEHRLAIQRLNEILNREGILPMKELGAGETFQSLPEPRVQSLQKSRDFQIVVQALRRIKLGSSSHVVKDGPLTQQWSKAEPSRIRFAYVLVPYPPSPDGKYLRFIADGDYEEQDENGNGKIDDDEQATPIGAVYNVEPQDGLHESMKGNPSANSNPTEDKWGVWISGFAPILDNKGNVIASIGVDYDASGEFNRLRFLRTLCIAVVAGSVVLSLVISFLLARFINRPVQRLQLGAEEVRQGNIHAKVEVKEFFRDELTDLADSFNSMVAQVRSSHEDQVAAIQALQETARLRDEFLSNFSHELNTPLAGIVGSLELLNDEILDPREVASVLSQMRTDAARLQALVANMMLASKIESNILKPQLEPSEIAPILDRAMKSAELKSDLVSVDASRPIRALVDKFLLELVLVEIFKNGILHGQATEQAPLRLSVQLDSGSVRISVSDSGPGVATGHVGRLGEKYFRVDSSLTYAKSGTGLGLYIARRLIELQGGRIWFKSPGGLHVTIELPVDKT